MMLPIVYRRLFFEFQIVVAGIAVPWLGYAAGYVVSRLFKQPHPDALAISIETGIVNTGIAIFMLRFSLPQPEADLTTGNYLFYVNNNLVANVLYETC